MKKGMDNEIREPAITENKKAIRLRRIKIRGLNIFGLQI
jgi:hypothetical protein